MKCTSTLSERVLFISSTSQLGEKDFVVKKLAATLEEGKKRKAESIFLLSFRLPACSSEHRPTDRQEEEKAAQFSRRSSDRAIPSFYSYKSQKLPLNTCDAFDGSLAMTETLLSLFPPPSLGSLLIGSPNSKRLQ